VPPRLTAGRRSGPNSTLIESGESKNMSLSRRGFAAKGLIGAAAIPLLASATEIAAAADAPADSTFNRVRQSKKLRIAGIVGTEPYYHKDLASGIWSGFCVDMAKDLAAQLEADMELIESTWGNAVLDLQSNKIDIMFGLSPTPKRALVVDFTRPIMNNTFTIIAKKGFAPKNWADLNKPEVRIAVDIGSTHDGFARRVTPKATIIAMRTPDEAVLALQSGKADCLIQVIMLSLVTMKKNAELGVLLIPEPIAQQPTCAGVRIETDARFKNFVDNWLEYNRSLGQIRDWITASLDLVGVKASDVPQNVQF
jgi:polar amino acid transport system substrate-binding protein